MDGRQWTVDCVLSCTVHTPLTTVHFPNFTPMKLSDILKMSFRSLINRRLRSWLTIVGIVIGVAAVVALVSIGQGFQDSIEKQLSGLGGNLIFISPSHTKGGSSFGGGGGGGGNLGAQFTTGGVISGNLTENDLRLVKSVQGVYVASGALNRPATLKYVSELASINVQGTDPRLHKQFTNVLLESGRYLLAGDDQVAVIGHNVAHKLFKEDIKLNSIILINGQSYRVVGILQQAGPAAPTDNLLMTPIKSARRLFSDFPQDQYSGIIIRISDTADSAEVAKQIEKKLFLSHHVNADTQDFTITTSQSILDTVGKISAGIKFFLGAISAISLLVGGIGIANTMFMSVMERTRQIGILKALGATNSDVTKLFLAESGIMGLVGGILGVFLGYFVSRLLTRVSFGGPGAESIQTSVTPELIIFVIIFSLLIGILAGVLPARRAAKLQPTEALRYE